MNDHDVVAIGAALRGDAEALRRFGVSVRPPWWRRHLQARVSPRKYRWWVQRQVLDQIDRAVFG